MKNKDNKTQQVLKVISKIYKWIDLHKMNAYILWYMAATSNSISTWKNKLLFVKFSYSAVHSGLWLGVLDYAINGNE